MKTQVTLKYWCLNSKHVNDESSLHFQKIKYIIYLAFLFENNYIGKNQLRDRIIQLREEAKKNNLAKVFRTKNNIAINFNNKIKIVSKNNCNINEYLEAVFLDINQEECNLRFNVKSIFNFKVSLESIFYILKIYTEFSNRDTCAYWIYWVSCIIGYKSVDIEEISKINIYKFIREINKNHG